MYFTYKYLLNFSEKNNQFIENKNIKKKKKLVYELFKTTTQNDYDYEVIS
jgi:hypothetical protein